MAIRRVLFLIQASRLVLLFVFWFFKSHFLPTNKAPSALRGGRFVGERVHLEPLGMTVRRNDARRAPFPQLLSSPASPRSGAFKSNGGRPTRGVSFFFGKKNKSNLIFRGETIIMIVRPSCEGVGGRRCVCNDPDGRIDRAEARRLFGVFDQNNGVPDTAYLCRVKGRRFCITNRKKEKTEWKANKRKRAVL